jgi:hypothetical protein
MRCTFSCGIFFANHYHDLYIKNQVEVVAVSSQGEQTLMYYYLLSLLLGKTY